MLLRLQLSPGPCLLAQCNTLAQIKITAPLKCAPWQIRLYASFYLMFLLPSFITRSTGAVTKTSLEPSSEHMAGRRGGAVSFSTDCAVGRPAASLLRVPHLQNACGVQEHWK